MSRKHFHRLASLFAAVLAVVGAFMAVPSGPASAADVPPVESMYPTNIRVTPVPGGAKVEWDPVTTVGRIDLGGGYGGASVADGYFVTSSYDPATNSGYRTCRVPASQSSCVVTGLVNGASYTFQVKTSTRMVSHNSPTWTGEAPRWSDYSPPTKPVTPCCGVPTSVSGVQASVSGDHVSVSWSPPSDWGGASGLTYTVTSSDGKQVCSTEATSCLVSDVPYGEPQSFGVTASTSGGTGTSARSGPVTVPVQAPQAPLSGRAKYTKAGQARVDWQVPSRNGGAPISDYTVTATPGGAMCTSSGATFCTVSGLSSGRAYTFTVRAKNRVGMSPASAPIVAGTLVTPASAPKNVSAQPSTTAIRLSWSRPASTGGGRLLRYVVQDGSRVACTTTQSGCTVSDLSPGSEHTFKVYAVNTSGQGRGATVITRTSIPVVAAPPPPVLTGPAPTKPVPTFS